MPSDHPAIHSRMDVLVVDFNEKWMDAARESAYETWKFIILQRVRNGQYGSCVEDNETLLRKPETTMIRRLFPSVVLPTVRKNYSTAAFNPPFFVEKAECESSNQIKPEQA